MTKKSEMVTPFRGEFKETTFFVQPPVEGVPDYFVIKGLSLIPKGMKLYLHPDTTHDGNTGPTYVFVVTDASLSVLAKAPVDETCELDGKRYVFPHYGGSAKQEVMLRLAKPNGPKEKK